MAKFPENLTNIHILLIHFNSGHSGKNKPSILGKTTWECFAHHVHFPTQQNYFQNDAIAERNPLPPVQCCFLQTPRDQAFFEYTTTLLSGEEGEGRTGTAKMFRKMLPKYTIFSQFCPRLLIFSLERFSQFSPLVKKGVMVVRYNISPPEWYRHTAVYYFTKFLLMFLYYLHVVAKIKKEPFVSNTNESHTILLVTRKRHTKFVMRTACNKSVQFTDR